jgi:hypothetical protein
VSETKDNLRGTLPAGVKPEEHEATLVQNRRDAQAAQDASTDQELDDMANGL